MSSTTPFLLESADLIPFQAFRPANHSPLRRTASASSSLLILPSWSASRSLSTHSLNSSMLIATLEVPLISRLWIPISNPINFRDNVNQAYTCIS
ncbi:hypothetical protein OIU76_006240 [Salix suchowensis]|nr:hypothetical protein OIU76_006240 [Salix suchowensis]